MFDRFIRLARARRALKEGRYLDALREASDPQIVEDRRAEDVRRRAGAALVGRAERRLEAGDVSLAMAEVHQLRRLADGEVVDAVARDVERARSAREAQAAARQQLGAEFRELVAAGRLADADALLAASSGGDAWMAEHLVERRQAAAALLEDALAEAEAERGLAALDLLLRARAIDRAPVGAARAAAERGVARAVAAELRARLPSGGVAPDTGCLRGALAAFAAATGRLPELLEHREIAAQRDALATAATACLQRTDDLTEAAGLARSLTAAGLELGTEQDLATAALAALADGAGGDAALAQADAACRRAGFTPLAERAAVLLAAQAAGAREVELARELLERGELDAARQRFVAFLREHPLHEGVRRELELLDEGMADLDRRLADARLALRGGRLREACTAAMALVGTARIAAEAQQILAEARERMQLVERGMDEVRVALHGRAAATAEGVRGCLQRLEELGKLQVDHESLEGVVTAVQCELAALEQCTALRAQLDAGELGPLAAALPELVEGRGRLLGPERLDARLCELGDALARLGEQALAEGRLVDVQRCSASLELLEPVRAEFGARAAAWRQEQGARAERVATLLADAKAALAARDLDEAQRGADAARRLWRESGEVQAFAHQLHELRAQAAQLDRVAAMADQHDLTGAQQRLDGIRGVSPMLRTKVFDMKRDLAKKQGLERAFLLRVDEGGELLVMRGESVSIGNVRQACADLPVLASVAGRHASIRRSMSFHGGMEDRLVADDGEVFVGERRVDSHALGDGDELRFGAALRARYELPTSRSLTSRLSLEGGFQVGGTDRVLLMKDRGRDGRVLIGPGRDVHVRVPRAAGEVEVYANKSGQMRVFCEAGGTIDGAAFQGEHPVAAGQLVTAAGVTFVLMPWQPRP